MNVGNNRDRKSIDDILPEYDQYLEEYVYDKIWSELSELDKKILTELAKSGVCKVKELRERLEMKSELFSVYRDRLKRKGVIDTSEYGNLALALPRFAEFAEMRQFLWTEKMGIDIQPSYVKIEKYLECIDM